MSSPDFEPRPELIQGLEREAYLRKLIAEDGGRTVSLLKKRLGIIKKWLEDNKKFFTNYKVARNEFDELIPIETRKPQSEYLTTLSLDITPRVGQAISKLQKAKRDFYEAIRSSDAFTRQGSNNRLPLESDERRKLIFQMGELGNHLNINVSNLNTLLFPDSSFSVTDQDINDPHKKIDYPFLDFFYIVSNMLETLDAEMKANDSKF